MIITTIERAELTLLVLPAERRADLLHAYPIDLGQPTDEIGAELDAVARLEDTTRSQLVIAGPSFEAPDAFELAEIDYRRADGRHRASLFGRKRSLSAELAVAMSRSSCDLAGHAKVGSRSPGEPPHRVCYARTMHEQAVFR